MTWPPWWRMLKPNAPNRRTGAGAMDNRSLRKIVRALQTEILGKLGDSEETVTCVDYLATAFAVRPSSGGTPEWCRDQRARQVTAFRGYIEHSAVAARDIPRCVALALTRRFKMTPDTAACFVETAGVDTVLAIIALPLDARDAL